MIELYLSKVTENSETETAGKMYARVSYKQTMDLHDMAQHMAEHNTAFSEGLIVGVLTDFVKCVREMVLNGNTVKVGNLAIFKATVESNGLEVLYDAQNDKVASATMGVLKEGEKTGAAVKTRTLTLTLTLTRAAAPRVVTTKAVAAARLPQAVTTPVVAATTKVVVTKGKQRKWDCQKKTVPFLLGFREGFHDGGGSAVLESTKGILAFQFWSPVEDTFAMVVCLIF